MIRPPNKGDLLRLTLSRDLVRSIKRGNPWVFAEALAERPKAEAGTAALLLDKQGRELAKGFFDPASPIAFRACVLEPRAKLDDAWARNKLEQALALRRTLFSSDTTGYRLINGEGDGLPGLVCDVYSKTAVMQFDGAGPRGFWDAHAIAGWLAENLGVTCVFLKSRGRTPPPDDSGETLHGQAPTEPIAFLEHSVKFTADVMRGQKTGFFLDQRENRRAIGQLASGRRVLNMFGYTGGFSVCAGLGGAAQVTTVDIAAPALEAVSRHWMMNNLDPARHHTVTADAFEFLESARKSGDRWDLVILDPPSFAPSQKALPAALASYQRLVAAGAAITEPGGLLSAASCSSHVPLEQFISACEEGISDARRRATVLGVHGQPADHPSPLALPEFRYLKFVIMAVE